MAKGRKTGGRQKGIKNKATIEQEARDREVLAKAKLEGISPLEYLLTIMRDEKSTQNDRMLAARDVLPYLHARRAPEDKQGRTVPPVIYGMPNLEADGSNRFGASSEHFCGSGRG
jgi:hypothetical protein